MSLVSRTKKVFRFVASMILDIDDTVIPMEQFKIISDLFSRHNFNFSSKNFKEAMFLLKRKHVVDSVIVAKKDGTIVASSEGNGLHEAITGTALFNYVCSEFPESKNVLVKSGNSWFMVFPFGEKLFIVKATAHLSTIELRALAREFDSIVKNNQSYMVEEYFETAFTSA